MKRNLMAFAMILGLAVCSLSVANAREKSSSDISAVDVTVKEANIRFEKGESDRIETEFYGRASGSIYDLKEAVDGSMYKITLNYTGSGMAPSIKEGGVIVKIPDDKFSLLRINGKTGSGIVLDDVNINTDITSESCAVIIYNEDGSHEMNIDSNSDSYEIISAPITEDLTAEFVGSYVEFTFTEKPSDLKFQLTDKDGYIELPANWNRDFQVGHGKPKMTVKSVNGIFGLTIGKDFGGTGDYISYTCTEDSQYEVEIAGEDQSFTISDMVKPIQYLKEVVRLMESHLDK